MSEGQQTGRFDNYKAVISSVMCEGATGDWKQLVWVSGVTVLLSDSGSGR